MARRRGGIHFPPPIHIIRSGPPSLPAAMGMRAAKLTELVAKLEEQLKGM